MAATPSIKIVKTIDWHGTTRNFSNRYHFAGGTPADNSHWTTFADLVVADEAAIYSSDNEIIEAVGYAAGSDVPVFSKAYTTAGTYTDSSIERVPAECCALMKWTTTQRSTKNHPIYLFSYWHGVLRGTGSGVGDQIKPSMITAYNEYATDWLAGYSDGTNTYVRAGPNGAVAQAGLLETYITHRDFPR